MAVVHGEVDGVDGVDEVEDGVYISDDPGHLKLRGVVQHNQRSVKLHSAPQRRQRQSRRLLPHRLPTRRAKSNLLPLRLLRLILVLRMSWYDSLVHMILTRGRIFLLVPAMVNKAAL